MNTYTCILDISLHAEHNDCTDWYADGHTSSGVYLINPGGEEPFKVYILCMHYGVTEEALLY